MALSKKHRESLRAEQKVLSVAKGSFSFMHNQGLCVAERAAAIVDGGAVNGSDSKRARTAQ